MQRFAPTFQKNKNSLVSFWCHQHWQSTWIKLLLTVNRSQQLGVKTPPLHVSNTGWFIPAPLLGCTTWTCPAWYWEEHSSLSSATTSARNQPGCLREKDSVLCYQHCLEDVCCAATATLYSKTKAQENATSKHFHYKHMPRLFLSSFRR